MDIALGRSGRDALTSRAQYRKVGSTPTESQPPRLRILTKKLNDLVAILFPKRFLSAFIIFLIQLLLAFLLPCYFQSVYCEDEIRLQRGHPLPRRSAGLLHVTIYRIYSWTGTIWQLSYKHTIYFGSERAR